jgi:hypothetical protein
MGLNGEGAGRPTARDGRPADCTRWLGGSPSLLRSRSKIACGAHRPLCHLGQLASNPEKVQNEGVTVEVQWSELQRDPKGVAALADRGDVRVRRRDGAALLLTREDRASSTAEGAVAAARALRNLLAHMEPQIAAAALVDEFPWADLLPQRDRAQFVTDFVRAFQASAEMGQWTPLAQTVREWKATAAVHADPELVEQLTSPLNDDFGAVPDPTED